MFVILFLYLTGVCYCQVPIDDVPAYILNFNSPVYVCTDPESQTFVDTSAVVVQMYNETTAYMTGMINFLKGMDSTTMGLDGADGACSKNKGYCTLHNGDNSFVLQVEIIVDKDLSGHYEMVITQEICVVCNEIGNPDSLYYEYLKCFGFPDKCPFEAGAYPVNDFTASKIDMPVNAANAGRYQVTINFYNNPDGTCKNEKTFIGCLKLDFIIEQM